MMKELFKKINRKLHIIVDDLLDHDPTKMIDFIMNFGSTILFCFIVSIAGLGWFLSILSIGMYVILLFIRDIYKKLVEVGEYPEFDESDPEIDNE